MVVKRKSLKGLPVFLMFSLVYLMLRIVFNVFSVMFVKTSFLFSVVVPVFDYSLQIMFVSFRKVFCGSPMLLFLFRIMVFLIQPSLHRARPLWYGASGKLITHILPAEMKLMLLSMAEVMRKSSSLSLVNKISQQLASALSYSFFSNVTPVYIVPPCLIIFISPYVLNFEGLNI